MAANPTASMTVGQPEMEKKDLFVNMEHPIGDNSTLYSFHGYTTVIPALGFAANQAMSLGVLPTSAAIPALLVISCL